MSGLIAKCKIDPKKVETEEELFIHLPEKKSKNWEGKIRTDHKNSAARKTTRREAQNCKPALRPQAVRVSQTRTTPQIRAPHHPCDEPTAVARTPCASCRTRGRSPRKSRRPAASASPGRRRTPPTPRPGRVPGGGPSPGPPPGPAVLAAQRI